MPEYPSISKTKPSFPAYLDFQALRRIGIDRVQQLSNKLWTDYNLHDPGVTILEVLCYAITDLGYRNNLEIEDLLALNLKDANSQEYNFFTPDRLLSCNPVTALDFRKRLIEIPGVRNAWLERLGVVDSAAIPPQVENYQPAIYVDRINGMLQYQIPVGQSEQTALRLNPQGLYRVYLDLESGQSYRPQAGILAEVKRVLCSHRNLCEDFEDVVVLGEEEIGLCTEIELAASADPEDVLVEIYVRVQAFLSPRLRFYTLSELLDRGKSPAEIFAGRPSALYDPTSVYRSNGFIDTAELAALNLPQVIHTSDLYQIIMDVAGVTAIKKLSIVNYIDGLPQSAGDPWCLHLTPKHRPVLGLAQSKVTFYKGNLPFKASADEVKRRYYEQQAAGIKAPLNANELDLSIPQGNYSDLADHYSIHHDFPLTYGISEDGLPGTASVLRQGQANQLKGYLVFFDQILANYLAQLAHVRDLFSWESEADRTQQRQRTYFTQLLTNLPGVEDILLNYRQDSGVSYLNELDLISEDAIAYLDRRNRFLDHLLARFAETFSDYVQLNYQLNGGRRQEIDIIEDKARFLREYPELSRDRFRAFNYCNCDQIWDTNNVSGFQKRVSRLLGTDLAADRREKLWQRSLNHYQIIESALGYKFSLTIDPDTAPLYSNQIYPTIAQAQTALAEFLVFAGDPTHYRRLTYRFYYHYGWEVTDETGEKLVTFDRQFPSQSARNANFPSLLQDLASGTARSPQLATDSTGLVSFQLTIVVPTQPDYTFSSVHKYPTEAAALLAAATAQQQILQRGAYCGVRIGAAAGSPELFVHYGYGAIDAQGNLVAESTNLDRFESSELRDRELARWLSSIQTAQLITEFPEQPPAYSGIITDPTGAILLQEIQRHEFAPTGQAPATTAACQAGNRIVELVQTDDNFRRIDAEDGNNTYSWELTNPSKDRILAIPPQTFATAVARDRSIAAIQAQINEEGFHVVEHILLRPKSHPPAPAISDNFLPISKDSPTIDTSCCATVYDPYSFWISIIIPYWPTRFRNMNFRQLVERTLQLEAPAHVGLKICWIDVCQMAEFETAYKNWLEQTALATCQDAATDRTGTLNRLLAILTQLKNVYPEGTLHDCDEGDPNDNPIVLDRTALGTDDVR
jgi:hypothetical protein